MKVIVIGLPQSGRTTFVESLRQRFADLDIIDDVVSPKVFIKTFNVKKDIVVFLNRTDTDPNLYIPDHKTIAVSVIRDYCYWLAATDLLSKDQWLEYNFRIPGEENDFVKELASKNRVFIIRSLKKVIEHFSNFLKNK